MKRLMIPLMLTLLLTGCAEKEGNSSYWTDSSYKKALDRDAEIVYDTEKDLQKISDLAAQIGGNIGSNSEGMGSGGVPNTVPDYGTLIPNPPYGMSGHDPSVPVGDPIPKPSSSAVALPVPAGGFKGWTKEQRSQLIFGTPVKPNYFTLDEYEAKYGIITDTNARGKYARKDTAQFITAAKAAEPVVSTPIEYWISAYNSSDMVNEPNKELKQGTIRVHKALAEDVTAIFKEIAAHSSKPVMRDRGSHVFRVRDSGNLNSKLSNHSFGTAFDFNEDNNPYLRGGGTHPNYKPGVYPACFDKNHIVTQVFEAHGWKWGGEYHDYMHFEFFHD